MKIVLLILMVVSVYFTYVFAYLRDIDPEKNYACLKFLAVSPIVISGIILAVSDSSSYAWTVVLGLAICLAADMVIIKNFIAGLATFLAGHIVYMIAFGAGKSSPWLLLPYLAFGIIVYKILFPGLKGGMKIAVFVYISVLVTMAWQSWDRVFQFGTVAAFSAVLGAISFMVSDSALALRDFRKDHLISKMLDLKERGNAIVMGTYVLAQWLIALSI